ncbi:hypothetical protein CsSME_00051653 [Camellia sinensis var. sinensis]
MAGYLAMKMMKRKDLEDVNDDFSDFSLSSPARKIRRLDAELPPIMEEEEADHAEVQKLAPEEAEDVASNINNMNMEELGGPPPPPTKGSCSLQPPHHQFTCTSISFLPLSSF